MTSNTMQNETGERRNLLTIGEASEYLGVSIDTLRRWEKRGRIEPYRSPGGHRHYVKEELDKLFDKKYVRDEPTHRPKGPYNEQINETYKKEVEQKATSMGQTLSTREDLVPPSTHTAPSYTPQQSSTRMPDRSAIYSQNRPLENMTQEPTSEYGYGAAYQPQTSLNGNSYSLPPWRQHHQSSKEESHANNAPPVVEREEEKPMPIQSQGHFYEVERPTREIAVPKPTPIRVLEEEALLTPQEAYFRQQSISILNPSPLPVNEQTNSPAVIPTMPQSPYQENLKDQIKELKANTSNENMTIYIAAGIGLFLIGLTWFLLWRSSQAVLSPIP